MAFITSKGTLDKENSAVRRYLAQRADLIGAIEQRLAQAAQLLLEGDWNVSEVAAIVGYGKASNFAAAFKKRYGVAPKNYRENRFNSAKNKV